MSGPFPGADAGKRVARLQLYKTVKATAATTGHAVTLAGTEPQSEIELLRDYLKWPSERTWFVDNGRTLSVRRALNSIRATWPGVNAVNDDIHKLLPNLPAIGFAYLDFMGPINESYVLPALYALKGRLLPGAVVGLTWFKGRELPSWQSTKLLKRMSGGFKGHDARLYGVTALVQECVAGLRPVDVLEYRNKQSPMVLSIFQAD